MLICRPKFMVDKIVPFPKYNPRTTKDLLSLVYVVVDEVGSAYNAFALSEPSKESGGSLRVSKTFFFSHSSI